MGRLTGETFSNANVGGTLSGAYAYTYDARGQVTGTSVTLEGGTPYTTSASYNDAGELTSQTYPDGDTLTASYDPASGWATGESVQVSGAPSATPLLSSEGYSALGLLTSATLGAFTGGSGGYSASYDTLGRLTNAQYTYTPTGQGTSTLFQVQPVYDALGNVLETTTTLPQGADTQVFCYDDLARLVWAGSSGTPGCAGAPTPSDTGSLSGSGASYSASYSYDQMNRLTSAPLGGYTYGDPAHADAATSIGGGGATWSASYDAAGNMTCRATSSATTCSGSSPTGAMLSYDNEGRLTGWQNTPSTPTQTAAYLYDGAGNRVQQVASVSGTTTTTSSLGNLEDVSTTGAITTTTAYYGSLAESVNGSLYYTLSDGLGSVSAAVNTSGQVVATQLYAPTARRTTRRGRCRPTRATPGRWPMPLTARRAIVYAEDVAASGATGPLHALARRAHYTRGPSMTASAPLARQLAPDLWLLDTLFQGEPGVIASYLLTGADGLALVDVGSAATIETLLDAIRATGHQPQEIEHILLTHIHLDHAGATGPLLRHAPNARVYVHHVGAPHLVNPEKLIESATRIYGDRMQTLWGEMLPVPEDRIALLDDGVETRVGERTLTALYTPGHAIHHVAFHDAAHAEIFPGDAAGVRLEDIPYVRPPTPPPDINLEQWSESIERLRALKPRALYLPHFGPTQGEQTIATHFDDLRARLYAWGEIVARGMRQGEDDQQLAADLAAAADPEVAQAAAASGVNWSAEAVTRYEIASNYLMSAQGYMRYYRKLHPEALAEGGA